MEARPDLVVTGTGIAVVDLASVVDNGASCVSSCLSPLPLDSFLDPGREWRIGTSSFDSSSPPFMLVSFVAFSEVIGRMTFTSRMLLFGLFDADDGGRCLAESCMLCNEFCLPRDAVGRPFGGGGDMRVVDLASPKVPDTGEDAGFGVLATFDAAVLRRDN